jgi:hypothetical protein
VRKPLGPGAKLAPLLPRQLHRLLGVAQRQPCARQRRVRVHARGLDPSRDLIDRRRVEANQLAAGANRRQDLDQARGQQDQVHELGRLLERLEHPVCRLVAELVDVLDHEHPTARLKRGLARGRHNRAVDVRDEDLVRPARRHPGQVRVCPGHRAYTGAVGIGRTSGQELGRHHSRRRSLPCAARPVEQVGV